MTNKITTTIWLATDRHGSTLRNKDGVNSYLPYGYCQASAPHYPVLRFNGQPLDVPMRCYLLGNGHRVFHTVLMRFLSPDLFSPFGKGGINCYAYCAGDPVNRVDPSGNGWFTKLFSRRRNETSVDAAPTGLITDEDPQLLTYEGARRLGEIDAQISKYEGKIRDLEQALLDERDSNNFLNDIPSIERTKTHYEGKLSSIREEKQKLFPLTKLDAPPSYKSVAAQDTTSGLPLTCALSEALRSNTH
ncbi:RHS repeat-associated core domain-containing protein [Pseudomonas sp. RtIB026]|uniref:RHS repeat-associated core domain-containing protein n=1 Tax=Pseudomonas sp. RtIB026 TaxID=2749999 RepID=UPI001942BD2F|nr:RHS repeat-associated core domain-containing protein [Pseudomonas sp. RtIB026]